MCVTGEGFGPLNFTTLKLASLMVSGGGFVLHHHFVAKGSPPQHDIYALIRKVRIASRTHRGLLATAKVRGVLLPYRRIAPWLVT